MATKNANLYKIPFQQSMISSKFLRKLFSSDMKNSGPDLEIDKHRGAFFLNMKEIIMNS